MNNESPTPIDEALQHSGLPWEPIDGVLSRETLWLLTVPAPIAMRETAPGSGIFEAVCLNPGGVLAQYSLEQFESTCLPEAPIEFLLGMSAALIRHEAYLEKAELETHKFKFEQRAAARSSEDEPVPMLQNRAEEVADAFFKLIKVQREAHDWVRERLDAELERRNRESEIPEYFGGFDD